jgi:beta-phosphoglucomutase-like phosphatase (HAD superfamily)
MDVLFQRLSAQARMAIVTSSNRAHFDQIHKQTSFLQHVALVVAAGDYRKEKPDPEPYLVALDLLQASRHETIAVEDSPRGLQAAMAAGIDCISLRTDLTRSYPFTGALAVVNTVEELNAEIQHWLKSSSA